MKIAVVGCLHGLLDKMYADIINANKNLKFHNTIINNNQNHEQSQIQQQENEKQQQIQPVDLIICCGDFQALRDSKQDMKSMSVPPKYLELGQFHRYYNGQVKAPILTIFIGGNHEASNHMRELYYGGWVAENIYYMGASAVIDLVVKQKNLTTGIEENQLITIGGVSGIESRWDYKKGLYETIPLDQNSIKSIFHYRQFETEKFKLFTQIQKKNQNHQGVQKDACEIFLSHEWPQMVTHRTQAHPQQINFLLKKKKHFRQDIEEGNLGARCLNTIANFLKPKIWFSGHLHVKFNSKLKLFENNQNIQMQNFQSQNQYNNFSQNDNQQEQNSIQQDPPSIIQFFALDKPVEGKEWRQYFDIYRVNGRILNINLDENKYQINDQESQLIVESLLDQRNTVQNDNKQTISIEMFYNPQWIQTLQLSQTIMPLQNTVYNDIPEQFNQLKIKQDTLNVENGEEEEFKESEKQQSFNKFSEELKIKFDEKIFEVERDRHRMQVQFQRYDGINEQTFFFCKQFNLGLELFQSPLNIQPNFQMNELHANLKN